MYKSIYIMKLNKFILLAALAILPVASFAQQARTAAPAMPDLTFTVVKQNPITSIKNQNRSSTCWCFSALAFLESEAIRINNLKEADYPDFSEMFVVSHSYVDRADKYIRVDGEMGFSPGSEIEDAVHHVMMDYGLVPQSAMPGTNYGTELPVHNEIDALAKAYVDAMLRNPNGTLSSAWKQGFQGIMDAYFGAYPERFTVNGKQYTPASYRDSFKLDADNYVSLTSFTHHPFYKPFAIEMCDNWRGDAAYNLPIDELMEVIYSAIENGYTTTWGGDVSESGFNRQGIGLLLDPQAQTSGSDMERWVGPAGAQAPAAAAAGAPKEINPTQEWRQKGFDEKTTTDDHGMQAFGIAKDQFGNKYLMIKNSWGDSGKYHGIWYMSDAYCRGKVIDVCVHKDAIPRAIRQKLGI